MNEKLPEKNGDLKYERKNTRVKVEFKLERRHSRGRSSVEIGMKKFGRKNTERNEKRHLNRNFNHEVAGRWKE